MSVLAAAQVFVAGAALGDVIGSPAAALALLVVAAVQSGVAYWVQAQVTPVADPRDADGKKLSVTEPQS